MAEEEKEHKVRIISPQAGGQERFVRSNIDVCFFGGVLNPQPCDSLVSTPSGFVRIGDIKKGDVISNPMGGTQLVNYTIDKGFLPCVEFTLQDGRKVESALTHNWLVQVDNSRIAEKTAEDIIDNIDKGIARNDKKHINRWRIPMCENVSFDKEKKLPLHPYLIGCLLGDGCLSDKLHRADFGTTDIEIVERIKSLGYNIVKESKNEKSLHYCIKDKFVVEELKKLGLWGHLAYTKFVPDSYKYASIENRFELLKGLFDTDGYCSKANTNRNSRIGYRTVSEKLAKDIQEIIWSLGGRCIIHTSPSCTRIQNGKKVKCATSYGLLVWIKNEDKLFFLNRKKEKITPTEQRKVKTMLSIMSYRYIGKKHCVCINVSGKEHLYLTNNYVITKNCGKTAGAVLSVAEWVLNPKFRGVFTRRTLAESKAGGSILDEFENLYGDQVSIKRSENPRITFPSGAYIDITQIQDETPQKFMERAKGWQYDFCELEEMTGYQFSTFRIIITRNRGKAGIGSKIRGTTNPQKNHWLRKFLDDYIGADGLIKPDWDGRVRYFFVSGETVESVVWGDTKKEVYDKCRSQIDSLLKSLNKKGNFFTYENLIKSFAFYLGNMSENKASIENNPDYVGSVAASGGKQGKILLEGNWDVDAETDENIPIPTESALEVFNNDPQRNGDRWITCDLADVGSDNTVALVWDGFHIIDIVTKSDSTPRKNAELLLQLAKKWDIGESHIIFDRNNAVYINDYIPEALGFVSYYKPVCQEGGNFQMLKDQCYWRLVWIINNGFFSFDKDVANRRYYHKKIKQDISVKTEFLDECSVIRFKVMPSGKKKLWSKEKMNDMLGKGRSMDLLDPCAMRMLPVLEFNNGDELAKTAFLQEEEDDVQYGQQLYGDNDFSGFSL